MTATGRPRSRRGSGEELREALVETAARLLDTTHDVETLSVRTVTSATGVSPTALYLHFADLAELVHTVKMRFFATLDGRLRKAGEPHAGDVRARLRAMGLEYLRYAREHPGHYAMIFHVYRSTEATEGPPEEVLRAGVAAFRPLTDAVGEALRERRQQTVTDEHVFEVTTELWTSLHGRAHLGAAMPWLALPAEDRFIDRLIEHTLPRV